MGLAKKVNRVLNIIILAMLLIAIRIWQLTTLEHEKHVEMAKGPRTRTVLSYPERGTIRDRFNIPLAVNKIDYKAAVLYDEIRDIPGVRGRREHIAKLSEQLGEILELDPIWIEDMIYSRASLFPNTPFVIKEGVDEATYYKLRAMEKDLPGIAMQIGSKRVYPQGKAGCGIVGYVGAINDVVYGRVNEEMRELKHFLTERMEGRSPPLPKGFGDAREVKERLDELKSKAYTLSAMVGKGGIEKQFDEQLRGSLGKKRYIVGREGRFKRELPGGKDHCPGRRFILSISSELQDYAEKLLAYSEALREERFEGAGKDHKKYPAPWIKGGSIVAMIPKTGEVVALASYPRFDPGDFTEKNDKLHQWLESETYLGQIWDGGCHLERELFSMKKGAYYTESQKLTWPFYLDRVLSKESQEKRQLLEMKTLKELLAAEENRFIDLLLDRERFSDELVEHVGDDSPEHFRELCQIYAQTKAAVKEETRKHFHKTQFAEWREKKFRRHIKKMRAIEKKNKSVQKPYTDYLVKKERLLFNKYWEEEGFYLVAEKMATEPLAHLPKDIAYAYVYAMRSYDELSPKQKKLARAFMPEGQGFMQSHAFTQRATLGSVFKLVTSYEACRQRYVKGIKTLNPLSIIDDYRPYHKTKWGPVLGFTKDGKLIPRRHQGGSLIRSRPGIGPIDLKGALEQSSNLYFGLLASDHIDRPADLKRASADFGFGQKTGIDLPGESSGFLPLDLSDNRTGLYAFSIGQHSLIVTPLQTAQMVATIANGGKVLKPQIVKYIAGIESEEEEPFSPSKNLYSASLKKVGIDFPLFTETCQERRAPFVTDFPPHVKRELFFPSTIREYILDAMSSVVKGDKGSARPSRIRTLYQHSPFLRHYLALKNEIVGKTSTAEIRYRPTVDRETPPITCKHIWFACISFKEGDFDEPELVVIVNLRYGDYGKEAAPLAAEIVHKWRELTNKYSL